MTQSVTRQITDDLDALINTLPGHFKEPLKKQEDLRELLEIVLDLGRKPTARFPAREMMLRDEDVTAEDLAYVISRIGAFGGDNRAGIERTLHRISALRNRQGKVIGLTCRVGRAVFGTIRIIADLIETGKSLLLLGRPGVGKTTMLREIARVLADDNKKRVVIVDTSNEIAGDGDVPHPAIGSARRMQVSHPSLQHAVMIEAVENHMPEVIVIDEIGTELEATAARTIAERGVQLIATAHGNTLENLMMNPTLSDLIGGIQSVTISDEEARRRGTQKSILERKAPPTFEMLVEIKDRDRVAVVYDVGETVDSLLRGKKLAGEIRGLDETGEIKVEKETVTFDKKGGPGLKPAGPRGGKSMRVFPFGINKKHLDEASRELGIDASVVESVEDADVLVTSRKHYQHRPQKLRDAESSGLPIFVLRGNTFNQMKRFLNEWLYGGDKSDSVDSAMQEAEEAIKQVKEAGGVVELSPQTSYIRRLQHQLAERVNLGSESKGKEPRRRVRIYTERQER